MSTEIKRTVCGICSSQCVMDLEVEDGVVRKIRRVTEEPLSAFSRVCVRGAAGKDYVYHADRVRTPLLRIGEKGEGKFTPITWAEAYARIAEKLNGVKADFGADSVAFYSGYSKWYRPMLQRLVYSFGTLNYGTESSSCFRATTLAQQLDTGMQAVPDTGSCGVLLTVAVGRFMGPMAQNKARGMKLICVDCRSTADIRAYADLHLRPRPGTDAAVAHCLAHLLFTLGGADEDYLSRHVHGAEEYRRFCADFTPEHTQALTGVPAEDLRLAARLIRENGPLAVQNGSTGLVHHINGTQTYRAFEALTAICGSYGRPGGNKVLCTHDTHGHGASSLRTFAFDHEVEPQNSRKIGADRFPVYSLLTDEFQAMDLTRQIREGTPYPVKALFALGLNARMFPDSAAFMDTLKELDFFVDADLFLTDTARYADIVLPAAASWERRELVSLGMDNALLYVEPAIDGGDVKSDEDIICDLARALKLDDPLLTAGPEACWREWLRDLPFTPEELMADKTCRMLPPAGDHPDPLKDGFATPSGKFELYSEILAAMQPEVSPLPAYTDVYAGQDESLPLILIGGIRTDRYAYAFHSRTHRVEALRKLRGEAAVDMHPDDAAALGLKKWDRVRLTTGFGSITVRLDLDADLLPGTLNMYQGYPEADVNTLLPEDHLDPISGFPGYNALRCKVEKLSDT